MEALDQSMAPSKGKNVAMVVSWLLGTGCLLAFNCILTIQDYYLHLFPKYHPSRVLTVAYMPFSLISLIILSYNEAKINTRRRVLVGFTIFFVGSLLLLALDLATSGKGGIGSFIGICIISSSFGVASAHVEGGMVGDLSFMQPDFIQSFSAGMAASGVIISALRIITKAAFENSKNGLRKGAIMFFAISAFFELLCVFLYAYAFPKLPIVKYYRLKAASEGSKTVSADLAAGGIQTLTVEENGVQMERRNNKELLKHNFDYAVNIFLIYMLTLFIVPGFLYEDTGSHSLGTWYVLVLISAYNVFDFVGRYIPLLKFLNMESRKGLVIATISRLFLFIPAFYFTAKYGYQGWMILLTSFLGLTNGYLTVCVFTSAPKGYTGPEQNALGNLLVLFLISGICAGVVLDWFWLIDKVG
ncbi:equilibrative nucleotide transporter 3-like isoform X2 [Tripterygium wilfordii]|uniref:equilibrative nucleotide transporter 3-like isoform X2 n=1 Tax=Tripterygium wilfordii TaxID=458696 RepID=UPI0018F82201|nr:equilibrative nucleotide transporter 3-like isoform X2 [Tripterygium wilfordii]XP_038704700.1 equilibrative nucleotide transporter 3-like isoform X2 [Tripterygium wilfordii]